MEVETSAGLQTFVLEEAADIQFAELPDNNKGKNWTVTNRCRRMAHAHTRSTLILSIISITYV